ncbi:MAG: GNAT family N-acetyltransferase [Pseudomonadota bacterium]
MSYSLTYPDASVRTLAPIIETERLVLRAFKQADIVRFAEMHADEDATQFTGGTKDLTASWLRMSAMLGSWSLKGFGPFAVEAKRDRKLVGLAGPWQPEGKWKEAEISYAFHPDSHGQGFAKEAVEACLRFVYETLEWPEAMSCIDKENAKSIALAEKLGARFERNIKIYKTVPVQVWRYPYPAEFDENWKLWGAE